MKKYFLLMGIAVGIISSCPAQEKEKEGRTIKPTQTATTNLLKAFPGSTNIKWEKENGNYEASFKHNGKTMSADFNEQGVLLESEAAIKTAELPALALQYIKEHYKGGSIKETTKIIKANGDTNYEAQVNKVDVIFDTNGKFIKEVKN